MLFLLGSATAAPGDFDPSFGSDGVVETPIGESSGTATGVVTQPDGKIVVGGVSSEGFTLVRYLPNGGLDGSFGMGGIATGPIGGAESLAIQPDGKLLLGGWTSGRGLSVARYNPDGGLDTSFGSQGVAHGLGGDASGIAVQPDGRIVAVGARAGQLGQFRRDEIQGRRDTRPQIRHEWKRQDADRRLERSRFGFAPAGWKDRRRRDELVELLRV